MENTNFLPESGVDARRNTRYERENAGHEMTVESTGDYVLPDYQPEIRKILFISSELLPSSRYVSGGRAEFGGTVKHCLVYTDADNATASVELSSDYDYAVEATGKEDTFAYTRERLFSVNCRLSGPRKLSIRAKIGATPHLISREELPMPQDTEGAELLYRETRAMECAYVEGEEAVTCEGKLDGYTAEELRVLSSTASVAVREAKREANGVQLRGDLLWKHLLVCDGSAPFALEGKEGFETLICEEMPDGASIVADGYVEDMRVELENNGEEGAVARADVALRFALTGHINRRVALCRDMYVPEKELCEKRGMLSLRTLLGTVSKSAPITGSVSRKESDTEDATAVVDTVATVQSYESTVKKGVCTVRGECRVRTVTAAANDAGETLLSPTEFTVPFSVECARLSDAKNADVEAYVRVTSPSVTMTDDALLFEGELSINVIMTADTDEECLFDAEIIGEKEAPAVSKMRIYYPEGGDTLWNVAKKYSVPLASIATVNHLSDSAAKDPAAEGSLRGISRLLIVD